jgi:hypothetical protein
VVVGAAEPEDALGGEGARQIRAGYAERGPNLAGLVEQDVEAAQGTTSASWTVRRGETG